MASDTEGRSSGLLSLYETTTALLKHVPLKIIVSSRVGV